MSFPQAPYEKNADARVPKSGRHQEAGARILKGNCELRQGVYRDTTKVMRMRRRTIRSSVTLSEKLGLRSGSSRGPSLTSFTCGPVIADSGDSRTGVPTEIQGVLAFHCRRLLRRPGRHQSSLMIQ
jgi:hypothetical protein